MNNKISTITLSTHYPKCNLNLINIGKYLQVDDIIIGIKYECSNLNIMKGKYSTTIYKKAKNKDENKINKVLFYNQITIIVNNNGNNVNVKLFKNGSLHLTGCKSISEGAEVTKLLYNKLISLRDKKESILLTKDSNNVLLDKDNLVYSQNDLQIIGHTKNNSIYTIHKKEYQIDWKTGNFISIKLETQRKKTLLNLNGDNIGFWKIELLKNKCKLYKKNSNIFYDYKNGFIYYNNNTIIGKFIYEIDDSFNNKCDDKQNDSNVMEIEYSCNPFCDPNYRLNTDTDTDTDTYTDTYTYTDTDTEENKNEFNKFINLDVNCMNIYFTLPFQINRKKLYEKLIDMNYLCKYKPESYSGIKMTYKLPLNGDNNGYCNCSTKCTCKNITFLIFQSGNVIATGFKNEEQIEFCSAQFKKFCLDNEKIIKKKELT